MGREADDIQRSVAADTDGGSMSRTEGCLDQDAADTPKFADGRVALIIFAVCLIIYLANGRAISTGDSVPNTLFGLNLLENCRWNFDNFRGSYLDPSTSHWFVESRSGHLNSAYPLGPSIVSFPICIVFWLFLKASHIPVALTSSTFEPFRLTFEHIAATIIASLTAVLYYLTSRLLFRRQTSLLTTCVFAFATNSWVTSSQGLWQHGSSNLVLLGATYSILRANRQSVPRGRYFWLLFAGMMSGLLPVIRPSNAIFLLAAGMYCLLIFKLESFFFCCGLVSSLPGFLYNLHFFDNLLGGYQNLFSPEVFSPALFKTSFLGSLLSPSRGLFVYSPVLLFSFMGLGLFLKISPDRNNDRKLILFMTAASLVVCSLYFFYLTWWAGHSFGPRFMTEALPMLVFLMNYFVDDCFASSTKTTLRRLSICMFSLLFVYSVLVQVVGAFGIGGKYWNIIPLNVDQYQWRLWSLPDTQIERHCHALMHRLHPRWLEKMVADKSGTSNELGTFSGRILSVADEHGVRLQEPLVVSAGERKAVQMELENSGTIDWIGYRSGREHTETYSYVQINFQEKLGNKTKLGGELSAELGSKLFVADSSPRGARSLAIGEVSFPSKAGDYLAIARLQSDSVSEKQNVSQPRVFAIKVRTK